VLFALLVILVARAYPAGLVGVAAALRRRLQNPLSSGRPLML